jgi:photosystem II stability/assembly factor-like uncharacterized protein
MHLILLSFIYLSLYGYNPDLHSFDKPQQTDTPVARNGVYLSTNYGMKWQPLNIVLPPDILVSYFERKGEEIVMATDNYGLFISENKRTRWINISNGLPGVKINAVHVSGDEIYAGVFNKGLFLSKDNGKNWIPLNKNLSSLSVQAVVKTKSKIIVATNQGIFSKKDGDEQWSNVYNGEQIISLNQSDGMIIAGGLTGVQLSTDGGDHWKQVHKGGAVHYTALIDDQIFALYMSGDVFTSDDWGLSWSMFTYFPRTQAYIYELTKAGIYFLMSNNYGVFRSANGGKNWDHIYKIEEIAFFDFIVFGNEIYAGTRLAKERRHRN